MVLKMYAILNIGYHDLFQMDFLLINMPVCKMLPGSVKCSPFEENDLILIY